MDYVEKTRKKYNRAVGIAEFIIEGNTRKDAAEEFNVSTCTIERDLNFLACCEIGNPKRNLKLYAKAKEVLRHNQ